MYSLPFLATRFVVCIFVTARFCVLNLKANKQSVYRYSVKTASETVSDV